MTVLVFLAVASLCVSVISLPAFALTRKRFLAYIGQGFFIVSLAAASLFASLHHSYFFAIAFAIFATVWLYKLATGKIISSPL